MGKATEAVGVITPQSHLNGGVRSTPPHPLNYIRATLADSRGFPLTVKQNMLAIKVLFSRASENEHVLDTI